MKVKVWGVKNTHRKFHPEYLAQLPPVTRSHDPTVTISHDPTVTRSHEPTVTISHEPKAIPNSYSEPRTKWGQSSIDFFPPRCATSEPPESKSANAVTVLRSLRTVAPDTLPGERLRAATFPGTNTPANATSHGGERVHDWSQTKLQASVPEILLGGHESPEKESH